MFKFFVVLYFFSIPVWAQCTQAISPITPHQAELLADLTIAKEYYMKSEDPSQVGTFEQRSGRLAARVKEKLGYFSLQRQNEYKNIVCSFSAEKTCTNGTHHLKTCGSSLVVPQQYSIIEASIKKTQNGDLKAYARNGNTFNFAAGRSSPGKATAFVSTDARYSDDYIKSNVGQEMTIVRAALTGAGIPTD
jgi:hypothetical protein